MLMLLISALPDEYCCKVSQLYHEHKNWMLGYARRFVQDDHRAGDVVQSAFIRVIKYIDRMEDLSPRAMTGYLMRIVKSTAIDLERKTKHGTSLPPDSDEFLLEDGDGSAEKMALNSLSLGLVKEHLGRMDDKYSLALILKYTMGFSHKEIANMLDISENNARARCFRARKMLIEAIGEELDDEQ